MRPPPLSGIGKTAQEEYTLIDVQLYSFGAVVSAARPVAAGRAVFHD